ncbi:uncharacterized protein LOC129572919, partial [Sitodiplosis mosellana]|uniref:uncharacterized protein LOC129572919 n=1 Tax=Sitodiplosis mosellana TaxID=263140 RepID=UPI002443F2DE
MNEEELKELRERPSRKLRRSNSTSSVFYRLNDRNKPESFKKLEKSDKKTEANKDFPNITDPEEKANAYQELAEKLDQILKEERKENLENLEKNTKCIKDQEEEINFLILEAKRSNESLLNTKDLLIEANEKYNKLKEEFDQAKEELQKAKLDIDQLETDDEILN